jgi:hypothetical protein
MRNCYRPAANSSALTVAALPGIKYGSIGETGENGTGEDQIFCA